MIGLQEIEEMKLRFGENLIEVSDRSAKRVTVTVNPAAIIDISRFLFQEKMMRFIIASAMETVNGIEILYHFSKDKTGLVLNIRVILEKENPVIGSLTGLFEAANWIEREIHEILGIHFQNHPNLDKLISDGNWAEGVYPYRKNGQ
jgi:NADH:ubiquinone oxidoreductase subunit C